MRDFLYCINNQRLYLDGGFGTSLIKLGFDTNQGEELNITNPDVVKKIHEDFFMAGSDIVYTNTFGVSRLFVKKSNYSAKEIIKSAVQNAKEVAKKYDGFVAYSCGSIGEMLKPIGELDWQKAYDIFKEQALEINNLDVDCVVLETFSDLVELKCAIVAFKENCSKPILCSMTFEQNGRALNGCTIANYAMVVGGLGVNAIGINCSVGADGMYNNALELSKWSNKPIFIKPNAGLPIVENGKIVYKVSPTEFAQHMIKIAELGISILGGCCGTNSEFILKTKQATQSLPIKQFKNFIDAVCSNSNIVRFDHQILVGESINPTTNFELQDALKEKDFDFISSIAMDMLDNDAELLDFNVAMPCTNEEELLMEAIFNCQYMINAPLLLDTQNIKALELALKVVNGVPIINSVCLNENIEKVFSLAKKYGAYVVALPMKGVPTLTVSERVECAKEILEIAKKCDISNEKLIFDGLVLPLGICNFSGNLALETAMEIKKQFNVKNIIGISNVSYGLPHREYLDQNFHYKASKTNIDLLIVNTLNPPRCDEDAQKLLSDFESNYNEFKNKN